MEDRMFVHRLPGQPQVLPQSHQISGHQAMFPSFQRILGFTFCSPDSPVFFWSVCRLCLLCRDLVLGVVPAEVDAAVAQFSLSRVRAACSGLYLDDAASIGWQGHVEGTSYVVGQDRAPHCTLVVICTATTVSSLRMHLMLSPAVVSASLVA